MHALYAQLVETAQAIVRSGAISMSGHGNISIHTSPAMAVMMNVIVEEAAQAAIFAGSIGGPKVVPPELLHASHTRAASFEARGTLHG
jgi:ribulose-5-phosphate 4-epimerase/fuculose-1-phosphate aldolase